MVKTDQWRWLVEALGWAVALGAAVRGARERLRVAPGGDRTAAPSPERPAGPGRRRPEAGHAAAGLEGAPDLRLLEDLDRPAIATDRAGRVAFTNRSAVRMLGATGAAAIGRDAVALGLPFPAEELRHALSAADGAWQPWQRRARLCFSGGLPRTVLVDASPLRDPGGVIRGVLLLVTDTGVLTAEHERTIAQLERANRIRSDFVATMSHELRTPLHVILGYADLLRGGEFGELNEEQAETVDRLLRRAHELHELVANTLDVSRIDAGGADLHLVEIAVGTLVAEAVAECARRPATDAPELVVDVPADLPKLVGDATKIKVVLKNLVGNALKFTERGRVTVAARLDGPGISFDVIDTGIGVDPAILPEMFEAFRQADPSPSRRFGGVGLGLYIVRRLLDLVGGRISVESRPGEGSRFTAWIPLAPPPAPRS